MSADAFIAHQYLAKTILGSLLIEAISISEGKGSTQASLWKIRQAIDSPDITQALQTSWSTVYRTNWDDPDNLLDESMLEKLVIGGMALDLTADLQPITQQHGPQHRP
jgi:hypothetical protein